MSAVMVLAGCLLKRVSEEDGDGREVTILDLGRSLVKCHLDRHNVDHLHLCELVESVKEQKIYAS